MLAVGIWHFYFHGFSEPTLIIFPTVITAILVALFIRLKAVSLDGKALVISNFRREIRVPLSELDRATGSIGGNLEFVWLHFKSVTPFGKTVLLMPPNRLTFGFSRHPLVAQLNALANAHRHEKGLTNQSR